MSTVMNKRIEILCKAVTTQVFTVVSLLVEPSTAIEKPNVSIEGSLTSGKLPLQ